MSPKHLLLLPILLVGILTVAIADELHPRTWNSAAELSSFDNSNNEPNQDIWKLNEDEPVTLDSDRADEELLNSYERRGLSEADVSSFDSNSETDGNVWETNEAESTTFGLDSNDEEFVNSYDRRGLSAAEDNSESDENVWEANEAETETLEDDEENSFEGRGLSDTLEDIEPNHKFKLCKCRRHHRHHHHHHHHKAPTPAPTQEPSLASINEFAEEGYEIEAGQRKFCKCKRKRKPKTKKPHPIPPTQAPAEAPAVF